MPAKALASIASKDARHGVDGITGGEKVGAFGGNEAKGYGVGRNEGERELSASRLEELGSQSWSFEDGCNEFRLRVEAVILRGKFLKISADTVPSGKQGNSTGFTRIPPAQVNS